MWTVVYVVVSSFGVLGPMPYTDSPTLVLDTEECFEFTRMMNLVEARNLEDPDRGMRWLYCEPVEGPSRGQ